VHATKFRVKISARRKKFMLLCRTVGFEISFNNYNRAEHKGRIPQYTNSSSIEKLNSTF